MLILFIYPVNIRQMNILSHNFKIGKEIQIYSRKNESEDYKMEGYLYLNDNLKNNYQCRELKSVFMDINCQMIKVKITGTHKNKLNLFD